MSTAPALPPLPTAADFLALRAALASEASLHAAVEAAPVGLIVLRPVRDATGAVIDFLYTYANGEMRRIVGRPLAGRRMRALFPSAVALGILAEWATCLAAGRPHTREIHYARDGLDCWVRSTGVPVDGGLVVWVVDVTEYKRAELDLRAVVAACRALGGAP